MRVTQGMMYNSFITNMNRTLGDYMESNIQSSSQKRVNRPSDDPVAAGRIMSSRANLSKMATWEENINTAYGWINLEDQVLGSGAGSVQEILSRMKVLAEEGADGAKSADNRYQISLELRQHFEQLINLANSKAPGSNAHIFAGHKTEQPAYVEGLGVTAMDPNKDDPLSLAGQTFNVTGGAALNRTAVIQATTAGNVIDATFRYSLDGGNTWVEGVKAADNGDGTFTMDVGGALLNGRIQNDAGNDYLVNAVDTDNPHSNGNGTWLYIRPTAIYQGDDHDTQVSQNYRPQGSNTLFEPDAEGNFSRDVAVRLDKEENGQLYYSYSVDDGDNWIQTKAPVGTADPMTLAVPGGYLKLTPPPDLTTNPQDVGSQFIIHPHRADINFQIADNSTITVNMVGKEIFGGLYDYSRDGIDYPIPVTEQANLFEVVGKLVASAETNSQQGMQEALEELDAVMKVVLTKAADAGGRSNRLTATAGMHLIRQFSEEDTLSRMEDVDVTELMTRLAQQQTAYQSVLKSSSMIMQMSLVNFL